MKYHTRHQYIKETGKRISKGAWERLNRAYAVHNTTGVMTGEYDADGNLVGIRPQYTLVVHQETPKHNRKISLRDRWGVNTKRSRYREGAEVGIMK